MKRYAVMGMFILAVVLFACLAFAGPCPGGNCHVDKHIDKQIDRHWNGLVRPAICIGIGVNRFGMKVEQYVLPPYPNRNHGKLDIRW